MLRVQGSMLRVQGSMLHVQCSMLRVQMFYCSNVHLFNCSMLRVQGSMFRVQGLMLRVQGSMLRVQMFYCSNVHLFNCSKPLCSVALRQKSISFSFKCSLFQIFKFPHPHIPKSSHPQNLKRKSFFQTIFDIKW